MLVEWRLLIQHWRRRGDILASGLWTTRRGGTTADHTDNLFRYRHHSLTSLFICLPLPHLSPLSLPPFFITSYHSPPKACCTTPARGPSQVVSSYHSAVVSSSLLPCPEIVLAAGGPSRAPTASVRINRCSKRPRDSLPPEHYKTGRWRCHHLCKSFQWLTGKWKTSLQSAATVEWTYTYWFHEWDV